MIYLVKCSFIIPVKIEDKFCKNEEEIELSKWMINENSCPGTSSTGAAFEDHLARYKDSGYCWACMLSGKNEIVGELNEEDYQSYLKEPLNFQNE